MKDDELLPIAKVLLIPGSMFGIAMGLMKFYYTDKFLDAFFFAVSITFCFFILGVVLDIIKWIVDEIYESKRQRLNKQRKEIDAHIKKIEMVCECGAVYQDGATFCARDGKLLTRRIVDNYVWKCPECGKTFSNGEKFCPEHGKELVKSPKE